MSELKLAKRLFDEQLFTNCNIVLFEDSSTAVELFPLSVLRPSWEIRSGAGCTRLWLSSLCQTLSIFLRPRANLRAISAQFAESAEESFDPDLPTVFLNGRVFGLWREDNNSATEMPRSIVDAQGRPLMCVLQGSQVRQLLALTGTELAARLVQEVGGGVELPDGWTLFYARYVWDYMSRNPEILMRQLSTSKPDSGELLGARALRDPPAGISLHDRMSGHSMYIGHNVKLMPGVVFGNHNGPIWIGSDTEIEPHTYIDGPAYIGTNCRIKSGTRIYHGTSLGPHCRVAGEITQSILQAYVNKQHEGFLGNSHLGHWVNLGADTTNSNLRNDYGNVKMKVAEHLVDSEEQYVGLMCGDHVKTGINTMFNTGTVVGIGANIYGSGYPPRFIRSFMWGGADGLKPGSLERTLESARYAVSRRGQTLSANEELLIRNHFAETVKEEKLS